MQLIKSTIKCYKRSKWFPTYLKCSSRRWRGGGRRREAEKCSMWALFNLIPSCKSHFSQSWFLIHFYWTTCNFMVIYKLEGKIEPLQRKTSTERDSFLPWKCLSTDMHTNMHATLLPLVSIWQMHVWESAFAGMTPGSEPKRTGYGKCWLWAGKFSSHLRRKLIKVPNQQNM